MGRGACQELLAGRAQAPGSCPSVGVRRTLTWSDPLWCVLPEVTAVHTQLSRSAAETEGERREEEEAALFSSDGGGGTV